MTSGSDTPGPPRDGQRGAELATRREGSLLRNGRVQGLIGLGAGAGAGFAIGLLVSGKPWHLPPAWGDIPGWITAIATIGLLIGAYFTARYARRAFLAQSKEVSDQAKMLQVQSDQLAEQRKINALQAEDLEESLKERARLRRITEREQADMIDLAPSSTSREVPGLDPSADGRAWIIDVTNGSRRPIRNVASRIMAVPDTPPQDAALADVYAEFTITGTRALIDPPERPDIPLIRAGATGAFIFPVGADLNHDARITVRFTDDADLHWQIDHDLHLQPLDNRDDW